MVTVIQSVCPFTETKFGKHLRCLDVGSAVFSGKCGAFGIKPFFPVQKGHHVTTVCGLEDRHFIESPSTKPVVCLKPLKSTRQYGFPPQQFNERSGSGKSDGW